LKLTNQEREIILVNDNILALGRSGTGKTTSAVFRMAMLTQIGNEFFKTKAS
jgi:hypothetical protein